MLSNVERAHFGVIAAVLVIGLLADAGIFALLVAGLTGYAAVTGTCLGQTYIEKAMDALGITK